MPFMFYVPVDLIFYLIVFCVCVNYCALCTIYIIIIIIIICQIRLFDHLRSCLTLSKGMILLDDLRDLW